MPIDQPHLRPRAANHRAISPLDGFGRALELWPDRTAILWRDRSWTCAGIGAPKGVFHHYRGAGLCALGKVLALGLGPRSAYLRTLPMFQCNGWCHPWAVTAAGGTHVRLDKVDPAAVFAAIRNHGATHMACAPGRRAALSWHRAAPRHFVFGSLPRTATCKVRKYMPRAQARDKGCGHGG